MALDKAVQGATGTGQRISWTTKDASGDPIAFDLTGKVITGKIMNLSTKSTRNITGTLSADTPHTAGIFSWVYSDADVADSGWHKVQFFATGTRIDKTYLVNLYIVRSL